MIKIHQDTNLYLTTVFLILENSHCAGCAGLMLIKFAEEFDWNKKILSKSIVELLNKDKGYNHYCNFDSEDNTITIGLIQNGI